MSIEYNSSLHQIRRAPVHDMSTGLRRTGFHTGSLSYQASDHAPNVQIVPIIEIARVPVTVRLPVYACGVGDERVQ